MLNFRYWWVIRKSREVSNLRLVTPLALKQTKEKDQQWPLPRKAYI